MFDKLDEIIKKFVAVFLLPLVNVVALSLIVYLVANPNIHPGLAFSQIIPRIFDEVVRFIGPNLQTINSSVTTAVQALSSFIAATIFIVFVIIIYLIDRAFYGIGYFLPPNFVFDLSSFGSAFSKTTRGARVLERLGPQISGLSIDDFYPVVRAYLGHKNGDPYRIAWRARVISQIDFAQKLFRYAKAYFCFLVIVLLASHWQGQQVSASGVFLVSLSTLSLCGGATMYLANASRRLVEYDLQSYTWARCYESGPEIDFIKMSAAPALISSKAPSCISVLLRYLNLRFAWLPE